MNLNSVLNFAGNLVRIYDENLANLLNVAVWLFGTRLLTWRNYLQINHDGMYKVITRLIAFVVIVALLVSLVRYLVSFVRRPSTWVAVAVFIVVLKLGICTGQYWHCLIFVSSPYLLLKFLNKLNFGPRPRLFVVVFFMLYNFFDDFVSMGVKCISYFKLTVLPLIYLAYDIFCIIMMLFLVYNFLIYFYIIVFNRPIYTDFSDEY